MSRRLTQAQKKFIAGEQRFKCNNRPNSTLIGLDEYECPLWKAGGEDKGIFDASGYDIDHITEWSISKDDSLNNLQALCISCHKVKTKKFMMNKKAGGDATPKQKAAPKPNAVPKERPVPKPKASSQAESSS